MRFTKLRLAGFKTFVEAAEFHIEPGLTGIVGPNGCGKSNLVEAMRWVMGETSHKAMRAADMDDVIFSGSGGRPARNTAEVTLTLDNTARTAPAIFNDYEVIEVSRRIQRDSGSTYRVNGREVRARDVQILFADASTGARSPAMVRQGQIGEIINARPEARRRVLEEAAGVAGLHARRREAEIRLEAAERNLERIEDVLGQLLGQIDALKRQSRQAIRYRTLSADIRRSEAALMHLRWAAVQQELEAAEAAWLTAIRGVDACALTQGAAARDQAVAAAAIQPLREAEAEAAAALQRLTLTRDGLDREEARARERMAELESRILEIARDIEREAALAGDAGAVLTRLAEEDKGLEIRQGELSARHFPLREALVAAEQRLAGVEQAFAEATAALAAHGARRVQLETAIRQSGDQIARLVGQLAALEAESLALHAAAGEEALAGLRVRSAEAEQRARDAEGRSQQAEAAHALARTRLEEARGPLQEAERAQQRLETEVRTLAKMLGPPPGQTFRPVVDLIAVDKGFEAALGAALGDDLEAPLDAAAPVRWTRNDAANDPALPAGVVPLASHVRAPNELRRRLAQIGVVDRAQAEALLAHLRPGQRLVSRAGDLWRWDGLIVDAKAPTNAARRLAERNHLIELEGGLVDARARLDAARSAFEAVRMALETATAGDQAMREARRQAQAQAQQARHDLSEAERRHAQQAARLAALAEGGARLRASQQEAEAARQEAEQHLSALPPPVQHEAALAATRNEVTQARADLAESRSELATLEREQALGAERRTTLLRDVAAWEQRRAGAGERIAALEARRGALRDELAALQDVPATLAGQRRSLNDAVETAVATRRAAADRLVEAEAALSLADRAARAALEALAAARTEAARAEERGEAAHRRQQDVAREILDALDSLPDELFHMAGLDEAGDIPDLTSIEANLARLRTERDRLGAVNLRAEDELREVQAAHDKLVSDRDDLVVAIRKLRAGIASLNAEARERLSTSFSVVNAHFQKLFSTLFGGGTAELQLVGSDDQLEAGLEILARPPGKKPQTLSLLSGGEQALTAMALIFAVFLTNPAPICVLDEVDAPLDDANVERFCDLLDEMARITDTRFIIITHNPISMARMNRLYGVTMAERGVSDLVSVDLETAEQFREAS